MYCLDTDTEAVSDKLFLHNLWNLIGCPTAKIYLEAIRLKYANFQTVCECHMNELCALPRGHAIW